MYNVTNKCADDLCMPCTCEDYEIKQRQFVVDYMTRMAKQNKLCGVSLDVGAHTGLWSVTLAELYDLLGINATVRAIEPNGDSLFTLCENATSRRQLNKCIVPMQSVAWSSTTQVPVAKTDRTARNYIDPNCTFKGDIYKAPAVCLDDVVTGEDRQVDFIKLDIEGAEMPALKGARKILAQNNQLLVAAEISTEHMERFEYTPAQFVEFMAAYDFRLADPSAIDRIKCMETGSMSLVFFIKGELE